MNPLAQLVARPLLALVVACPLLVACGFVDRALAWADEADPIAAHLGRPLVVEFPKIDDLGDPLQVPAGWGFMQADADTIDALRVRLRQALGVAVIYVDRFGNVLHVDKSTTRRQRVARGVREFERKQQEIIARLEQLRADATAAAERGRRSKELDKLRALLDIGVVGYPIVSAARLRWQTLDAEVWQQLLSLLAREGLIGRRELQQELRNLLRDSTGLPVATRLEQELRRLKAGFIVRDRRP